MMRTAYFIDLARHSVEMRARRGYGVRVSRLLLLGLLVLVIPVGCGGSQQGEPPAPSEPTPAEEATAEEAPQTPEEQPIDEHAPAEAPPTSEPPVEAATVTDPPVEAPRGRAPTDAQQRATLTHANEFGFDLYQRLRRTRGNLVLSPASIYLALSMAHAGARGETATQMGTVLHTGGSNAGLHAAHGAALRRWNASTPATLRVANRLFADRTVPVEPTFVALTGQHYDAPLERLDFASAPESARLGINQWVEARTQDRIADLLPAGSITSLTRLVLANAIYFKGTWLTQFDPSATAPQRFQTGASPEPAVPSMALQGRFAWANHPDGVRVLELPYAGNQLSMVFLLPSERTGAGALDAVEAQLSQESLTRWLGALREVDVQVQIPRFRLEPSSLALSEQLQAMGMPLAFDDQADFSGIATLPGGLFISEVFHKAFVEVNEEGTEAAAATAVVMNTRRAGPAPEPPRFIADHPFLFVLMDRRTGAVLFLGRVSDPR